MSRPILAAAATISLAAFALQTPALAQQDAAIVITAPAVRNAELPRTGANPRMQLAANVLVHTGDLDLRTGYGRAVLEQRVRIAADVACDRLDRIDPGGVGAAMNPDAGDCRHLAAKSARPQVRTAIALAG